MTKVEETERAVASTAEEYREFPLQEGRPRVVSKSRFAARSWAAAILSARLYPLTTLNREYQLDAELWSEVKGR